MCEDWDVRPCSAQRPLPKGHAACTGMGWPQKGQPGPQNPRSTGGAGREQAGV